MKSLLFIPLLFTLYPSARIEAQQQPQTQPAPCSTSVAANTPSTPPQVNLSDNAKKYLTQKQKLLQKFSPIALPDLTKLPQPAKPAPTPCPPRASVPAPSVPAATSTTAALPWSPKQPDTYVTLHCNPTLLDPTGKRHEASSLLDPETFAVPKANEPEVDRVERDNSSSTPCYRVKINGKNYKYFLQQ